MYFLIRLALFLTLALPSLCFAGDTKSAEPQLVQSYPIETELRHPTLPLAKDVWLELIRKTKKTIEIEQMYVASESGEALEPVLTELEAAARRGVRIRLILSKQMFASDPKALERVRAIPGIEI